MIEKLHFSTLLFIAAVVWGVVLLLNGVAVSISWLRPFGIVIAIVMFLLAAFDLYLWKLPILHPWFVNRPVVDGTWRAEIRSHWINPETDRTVDPIAGFMVVRQTFSRLSLRLITVESQSELLGAEMARSDDGSYRIVGVYRNEPRLGIRERSPIHYGGLALEIRGEPPVELIGHYWTDRQTQGEIALSDHRSSHVYDVESGAALYVE
jgi:hypothetical protein